MTLDYHAIQELAKDYKKRSEDFYALTADNDPYYLQNNPSAIAKAEWFADLYKRYWSGLTDKLVRSLHYAILHRTEYLWDGETRYSPLHSHYEKLLDAAKAARYLGYVPMDIVDETSNVPHVYIPDPMPDPELAVDAEDVLMEIEFFEFPDRPHYHLDKYPTNQRYQIEIWCEKSFSSLDRLAEEYGAVFQKGKGEMALACAHMLTERRKKYNRPVRIFYIHDLDPSGHGMPVSVARKLEFLLEDIRGNEDVPDVKLYNLVLTKEQVLHYDLPPAPVKSTDPRKNAWEVQFGKDIVELNALEEMHKGALARIVRNAIRHYYDTQLGVRAYQAQAAFKEYLEEIEQGVYDEFPELEELEDAYDTLVAQVEPELKRINDGIAVTWQRISDRLNEEMPDIEEYLEENPLPVARAAEELPDPLYDSTRDEFNQLAIYKQHQGKRIVF